MIYWLKRLEWKIRKALGLNEKKIHTINDVDRFDQAFLYKMIILAFAIIIAIRLGEAFAHLWWWFFPRRHWLPVIPV